MEYYWTLFNHSNNASSFIPTVPGQHRNFTPDHSSWDFPTTSTAAATSRPNWTYCTPAGQNTSPTSLNSNPDPHLTRLKLGKRHYLEDLAPQPVAKRGKSCVAAAAVPRCQVEGCEAVLVNAKDYHRRHKVCEMHAKAPNVVVLGVEQRFCQQCSRFHAVAEFDEAKRSCRRRLAGHNERRRKTSQEHHSSLTRKHYLGGRPQPQPHLMNNSDCALSLLSPANYSPWTPTTSLPDLPARCSAALRELIAENRASLSACRQVINPGPENRGHVTLNLMQGPDPAFGVVSGHNHGLSEEDGDGDCCELWKLPLSY